MDRTRITLIDLAVMVAIGLVLALLGPFGTFEASLAWRCVYWLSLIVGGYFLYLPAMMLADRAAHRLDLPAGGLWAASCALASLPMTMVVWSVSAMGRAWRWPTVDQFVRAYAHVLVIGGIACLVLWFVGQRRVRVEAAVPEALAAAQAAPAPSAALPRFVDRLPPHLGRDLLALEMEDHYVRAHTALGSTLILMRMRDAVAELDGAEGAQVHRSWWVARHAVAATRREGRNVRLALVNGAEAPVARDMAAALRVAGWF
ncbi:LytR family transcriptional regulator [Sphingomonas metalli]|uniref:LytR family transcriptional regulator n=1 Tax=Sphingomonas metalli TaxID=1779358 RepID=A0A916WSI8_9SPHN|nr:LytTR family DNA-binding domain-containing protein [Sphingomonas metalli]GGB26583.1 LytR family transcriptional regulator [Sphingomonas metalli]